MWQPNEKKNVTKCLSIENLDYFISFCSPGSPDYNCTRGSYQYADGLIAKIVFTVKWFKLCSNYRCIII